MQEEIKKEIYDGLTLLFCMILPLTGILIFIYGAFIGSSLMFFIGFSLFVIPLTIIYLCIWVREMFRRARRARNENK